MNVPTPIEKLPRFNSGGSYSPWLKYIIVGGVILIGLVISDSMTKRAKQISIKPEKNENGKD